MKNRLGRKFKAFSNYVKFEHFNLRHEWIGFTEYSHLKKPVKTLPAKTMAQYNLIRRYSQDRWQMLLQMEASQKRPVAEHQKRLVLKRSASIAASAGLMFVVFQPTAMIAQVVDTTPVHIAEQSGSIQTYTTAEPYQVELNEPGVQASPAPTASSVNVVTTQPQNDELTNLIHTLETDVTNNTAIYGPEKTIAEKMAEPTILSRPSVTTTTAQASSGKRTNMTAVSSKTTGKNGMMADEPSLTLNYGKQSIHPLSALTPDQNIKSRAVDLSPIVYSAEMVEELMAAEADEPAIAMTDAFKQRYIQPVASKESRKTVIGKTIVELTTNDMVLKPAFNERPTANGPTNITMAGNPKMDVLTTPVEPTVKKSGFKPFRAISSAFRGIFGGIRRIFS